MLGRKNHFGKIVIAAVNESVNGEVIVAILMHMHEGELSPGGLLWI